MAGFSRRWVSGFPLLMTSFSDPENHHIDPVRITGIASRTMESVQKSLHLLRSRPVRTRPQHQQAMIGPFKNAVETAAISSPSQKKNESFHSDMRVSQFPLMCSWVVVFLFTMRPQCASPKRIDACFLKKHFATFGVY